MNRLHREVLLGKNMCCESDPPHYTLRFLAPRWQFIVSKLRKLIAWNWEEKFDIFPGQFNYRRGKILGSLKSGDGGHYQVIVVRGMTIDLILILPEFRKLSNVATPLKLSNKELFFLRIPSHVRFSPNQFPDSVCVFSNFVCKIWALTILLQSDICPANTIVSLSNLFFLDTGGWETWLSAGHGVSWLY